MDSPDLRAETTVEAGTDRAEPPIDAPADRPADLPADIPADKIEMEAGEDRPDTAVDHVPDGADASIEHGCGARPPEVLAWEPPQPDAGAEAAIATITTGIISSAIVVGYTDGTLYETTGQSATPHWGRMDLAVGMSRLPPPARAVSAATIIDSAEPMFLVGYAGGHQEHVWKLAGQNGWSAVASPTVDVWGLSANPVKRSIIYGAFAGPYVYVSSDNGLTWETSQPAGDPLTPWSTGVSGQITAVVPFFKAGYPVEKVWVGMSMGEIAFTFNASTSPQVWTRAGDTGCTGPITRLTLDAPLGNGALPQIYASCPSTDRNGMIYSPDGGSTWRSIHGAGIPAQVVVYGISVNPIRSATLYANTSAGTFVSDDGGACWSQTWAP